MCDVITSGTRNFKMLKFQFYVYRMKACLMLIIFYKRTMLKKSTFLELRGFKEFTDYRHDVGNVLTFILNPLF